ncbi:MAG: hypothetical protein K0S51_2230 [Bacillales bacterium]|jgi:uncharacterized membrane protein YkvA (DUF1232 family)|nr:hypothetical protein [Bacillales bacterium]
MDRLISWAKMLKEKILLLYYSIKDPRLNILVKLFSMIIVGYALSPVDLIPDFIPVLGILDDLVILPIGIYLSLKMIPEEIITTAKVKLSNSSEKLPKSWKSGLIILIIWTFILVLSANYIVNIIYS